MAVSKAEDKGTALRIKNIRHSEYVGAKSLQPLRYRRLDIVRSCIHLNVRLGGNLKFHTPVLAGCATMIY
jgi:hypothetical protein